MTQHRIQAPMACTVVEVLASVGQSVRAGQPLLIVEAMKMEHEICAEADAQVLAVSARAGELVAEGDLLMRLGAAATEGAGARDAAPVAQATAASGLRTNLQEVL